MPVFHLRYANTCFIATWCPKRINFEAVLIQTSHYSSSIIFSWSVHNFCSGDFQHQVLVVFGFKFPCRGYAWRAQRRGLGLCRAAQGLWGSSFFLGSSLRFKKNWTICTYISIHQHLFDLSYFHQGVKLVSFDLSQLFSFYCLDLSKHTSTSERFAPKDYAIWTSRFEQKEVHGVPWTKPQRARLRVDVTEAVVHRLRLTWKKGSRETAGFAMKSILDTETPEFFSCLDIGAVFEDDAINDLLNNKNLCVFWIQKTKCVYRKRQKSDFPTLGKPLPTCGSKSTKSRWKVSAVGTAALCGPVTGSWPQRLISRGPQQIVA